MFYLGGSELARSFIYSWMDFIQFFTTDAIYFLYNKFNLNTFMPLYGY